MKQARHSVFGSQGQLRIRVANYTSQSLFDGQYFADQLMSLGVLVEPTFRNYKRLGWRQGLSPTAWFDVPWYLSEYPDVARSGVEPFLHFIAYGSGEGRKPRGQDPARPSAPLDLGGW